MDRQPKPPIPYLLAYAATVTLRKADEELRPHRLTVRQYGLLAQLGAEPELTMSELARQLGVSRQTLHEMVGDLEKTGYLCRRPGASGRTRRIVLTPRTLRLLAAAEGPLHRMEVEFLGGLSRTEIETLRTLLRRLLAHATDDEAWLSGT